MPSSVAATESAGTQRSPWRMNDDPSGASVAAAGRASHASAEFNISTTPRRAKRARSMSTSSPHGMAPVARECSTPSGM